MNNKLKKNLIIVKVGTKVLVELNETHDRLDQLSFKSIGDQLRKLSTEDNGVILVSSGAITAGVLNEQKKRREVQENVEMQRYAARGWDLVVQKWKSVIGDDSVSSTLLTKREINNVSMREQALDVITCCLSHGDIFVINENDTISDDEIRFGDNDTLAAELSVACSLTGRFRSVKWVLLSSIDGVNRIKDDSSTVIRKVTSIEELHKYINDDDDVHSRGGMYSKINAAKIAAEAGVETFIANGRIKNVIERSIRKEVGTFFSVTNKR